MKYTRELTFRRKTFSLRDAVPRYVDDDDDDNNDDGMFSTCFPPVFSSFIPFVASDASVDLRHFLFLFHLTLHSLRRVAVRDRTPFSTHRRAFATPIKKPRKRRRPTNESYSNYNFPPFSLFIQKMEISYVCDSAISRFGLCRRFRPQRITQKYISI